MTYDIFTDEEEKAEARQSLVSLVDHPGWKLVVRALGLNAAHFSEELRTRKDFESLVEVYALQNRISDLESYAELPANLLIEAQAGEEDEEEGDIYPDK